MFCNICQFAKAVILNIEERFSDLPLWSSMKIASYPTQLHEFGNEDVDILLSHFSKSQVVDNVVHKEVVDTSLFQREWPIFKRSVFDN